MQYIIKTNIAQIDSEGLAQYELLYIQELCDIAPNCSINLLRPFPVDECYGLTVYGMPRAATIWSSRIV